MWLRIISVIQIILLTSGYQKRRKRNISITVISKMNSIHFKKRYQLKVKTRYFFFFWFFKATIKMSPVPIDLERNKKLVGPST